jgi:hypothetical protein
MDADRGPLVRRERITERERTQVADRFGVVLGLLIATVFFTIAAPEEAWARLVTSAALAATAIIAMWASGAAPRIVRAGYLVAGLGVAVALAATVTGGAVGLRTIAVSSLALTLLTMTAIGRRIRVHAEISAMTIVAALCVYILIGLMFAFVYETLGRLGSGPFFAASAAETRSNFVYFSSITLATVGYGDLTAVDGIGRAFAVTEGLVGQIYLVTAVAALVGNLGRSRTPGGLFGTMGDPKDAPDQTPSAGPPAGS